VGGTALFRGTNLGTSAAAGGVTNVIFTTAPTASGAQTGNTGTNRGILAWALVDTDTSVNGTGISFAAPGTATTLGLQALSASERITAGATLTAPNVANMYFDSGTSTAVAGNTSFNSFTFTGTNPGTVSVAINP
jgi:hypothetical protein